MKKKITVLTIAAILVIVAVVGVMVSVTAAKNTDEFCKIVTDMLRITLTAKDLETDISLPSELTDEQKENVMSDYTELLKSVYTETAVSYNTYLNAMETDLSSQRTKRELVTDLGIFSMDVTSLDADSDSTVMTVDVEYWTKYIKERDSGFDVLFPVTKDTLEVSFVCKDGKWLISNQKLVNHLFDGDKDAKRHTETYDEALQYAKNTTPVNIFSK